MASSLGAGLNSLVSGDGRVACDACGWPWWRFASFRCFCSFLTGTKLLSAIAGDGTLPILRFFKAVSRLPELCCILLPRGDFQ